MKQRGLKLLLGLAMATLVGLIAYVDLRQNSPGGITRVHRDVAELEGRSGCAQCHGGWGQDMASACLECHEPVQLHLESREGLHGHLDPIQAQACSLCHSEHHGPNFAMTNFRSFALAVASSAEEFEHSFVDFDLAGAHSELSCVECHELAEVENLREGQQRYMGLSRDCASCHEDPHEGAMQQGCADCHGQDSFDELFFVGHAEILPLEGGHASMDCRTCHAEEAAHALEKLAAEPEPRVCSACHSSPHSAAFEYGNALLTGLPLGSNCASCHASEHESFLDEALELSLEEHAVSGFELLDPHGSLECAACHGDQKREFAARFPGRDALGCGVCHEDPHGGQFEATRSVGERAFAAKVCVDCHNTTEFVPHIFDKQAHALTELALEDAHAAAECNLCHLDPVDGVARAYRGTDLGCATCHADVHQKVFDDHIAASELGQHGQCALCHQPTSFSQVDDFEHGKRTDFPVRGAHAASACAICHAALPKADALGRNFALAPAGVEQQGCALCHADPHQGVFGSPNLPQQVQGQAGCARCHVEHSFREFEGEFDHQLWTGFDLLAAHGELSCAQCHLPLGRGRQNGLTWKHAAGAACGDCHESPHAGQFQQDGRSDCASCHSDASSFANLSFEHDKHTRFELRDEHADLACNACHETWIQGDLSVVRYRGVESDCAACHGLQKNRLRGKR